MNMMSNLGKANHGPPDWLTLSSSRTAPTAQVDRLLNQLNLGTVRRLYSLARTQASFGRSLSVLQVAADQGLKVKTGLMLGMGETPEEIEATLVAILATGCRYLTLGQYLSPSKKHVSVARYVQPGEFEDWDRRARALGFADVAAGPLIRSSYKAEAMLKAPAA